MSAAPAPVTCPGCKTTPACPVCGLHIEPTHKTGKPCQPKPRTAHHLTRKEPHV